MQGASFIVKLLVPARVAGGVIGKGGENINAIRKASGAKVELSPTPNLTDRVVRPRPWAACV